ncbi:hypothetical protein PGH47_26875 [Streptomyces sp. HUAS 31]|uniref:hypothetical protein n=1 Tax=Streptomyces sp. HUAS 31 TaxID=3020055 RepID=UPI0023056FE4|nr:hypothetical protein [Streptomyces sp. HUAS 31]WCD99087.1 hypothetical protein PGH47_26875 [Streptomyces sp. HUAS 31]
MTGPEWVPPACTLPTKEQPLRLAEWDALFATRTAAPYRPDALRVRLELPSGAGSEERARDLAARENDCCSFFDCTVTGTPERVVLDIAVSEEHEAVLSALAARADRAAAPGRAR